MANKKYGIDNGDRFIITNSEAKAIAYAQRIAEEEGRRVVLFEGADHWELSPTPTEAPVEPPSGLTDVSTYIRNFRESGAMGFNIYGAIEPKTKNPVQ